MYKVTGDNMNIVQYTKEDNQFYPTPEAVADKLLEDVNWNNIHDVLEPSCGKGDLVYFISKNYLDNYDRYSYKHSINVDGIEIDEFLRSIALDKFTDGIGRIRRMVGEIEGKSDLIIFYL